MGNRIFELRKSRGLTQKQLGQQFGLAESTISLYEAGKRQPDYETLSRLADYVGVSIDYLLGRSGPNGEAPTPEGRDGRGGSVVRIAGRDGSLYERRLLDVQRELLIQMLDNLQPMDGENV